MQPVSTDGLGVGPGHGVSDDEVAGSVLNSLYWDYAIPRDRLNVRVEKGWVTLTGEVEWDYQRDCAESDALKARGVTGVTNKILLSHGLQTADAKEVGARLATAASKLRRSWRCAAIVEYWVTARRKRWMTEEAARAQRHRTLLEDNPTSG